MPFSDVARQLQSVIAIPVTPFDARDAGQIDWEAFRSNVERQLQAGIAVLTPNGNTSEFFSLTLDETARICRETLSLTRPDALCMPGVGHDLETAKAMTRQAAAAGARAVMIHQPAHPFIVPEGWVAYHRAVADSAPDLAVTCYLRDPGIGARELQRLADACPNFVGVKYAVPDVVAFAAMAQALEAYPLALICGLAETWAPFFWAAGAQGFTSGLVNVTAALPLALLQALRAGNRQQAMRIWRQIRPFESLRGRDRNALNVSVVKEAMHQLGFAARAVRPPLDAVPADDRPRIGAMLRAFGLSPVA